VIADITKDDDRKQVLDKTLKKFQRLDVLVNNAGIAPGNSTVCTGPLEVFDDCFNVNVRSVVAFTQLFLPTLRSTKGSIVNVGSIVGVRPAAYITYYSMSKAAIEQFTKCLAMELAKDGVRVNAVNPAVTRTGIFESGGMTPAQITQFYEDMKLKHPLGRVGEPEEVAKAIAFLASDYASFTTGESLLVDGGRACAMP